MRLLSAAFGLCAALVLPAMVLPAHAEQSIEANSKTTAAREQTASKDATAPVALAPAHALALHGELIMPVETRAPAFQLPSLPFGPKKPSEAAKPEPSEGKTELPLPPHAPIEHGPVVDEPPRTVIMPAGVSEGEKSSSDDNPEEPR